MFSNIGSDANIDWATLAQQWIQRNTQGIINEQFGTIETPPPPNINQTYFEKRARTFDEKGEADMDMDDDELPPSAPSAPSIMMSTGDPNLLQFPLQASVGNVDLINQRPDLSATWNSWMNPTNAPPVTHFPKTNSTAHIPSLMKITVPNPNDTVKLEENSNEITSTTLDAAKRKVLPAWLREGLEKMEREKQKQMEREQQMKARMAGEKPKVTPTNEVSTTELMVKDHVVKSLESDDSSGNEQDDDYVPYNLKITNKTKHTDNNEGISPANLGASNDDDDATVAPEYNVGKTYEQKLADLMISVRRTLTELLLEVTNDEIAQIAKETLNSSKLKASSAQVIRKSALSSITNRLGLAAYSSSGDESDGDSSTPPDNNIRKDDYRRRSSGGGTNTVAEDSEEEIKSKLRMRRRAFIKTTEEIEERVAVNAAREEQKLRYYKQKEQQQMSNDSEDEHGTDMKVTPKSTLVGIGKNNARDFGETTTESKLQQSNGKRSKDRGSRRGERITRFTDNKDSKNITVTSYMSQINAAPTASTVPTLSTSVMHGFQIATPTGSGLVDTNTNMNHLSSTSAASTGINSMLRAAEVALEKASKSKSKTKTKASTSSSSSSRTKDNSSRDRKARRHRQHEHRRRHSSDESDSSSSSSESTDSTSSSDTSRDSKYSRASSNSASRHKRSSHSSSSHSRYNDRRRHEVSRSRQTSSSLKHSRRQRSRSRDRSRSRSTYSSSSSKRYHNRH